MIKYAKLLERPTTVNLSSVSRLKIQFTIGCASGKRHLSIHSFVSSYFLNGQKRKGNNSCIDRDCLQKKERDQIITVMFLIKLQQKTSLVK